MNFSFQRNWVAPSYINGGDHGREMIYDRNKFHWNNMCRESNAEDQHNLVGSTLIYGGDSKVIKIDSSNKFHWVDKSKVNQV